MLRTCVLPTDLHGVFLGVTSPTDPNFTIDPLTSVPSSNGFQEPLAALSELEVLVHSCQAPIFSENLPEKNSGCRFVPAKDVRKEIQRWYL